MTRGITSASKRFHCTFACISITVVFTSVKLIYLKRFSISVGQLDIEEMVMVFDMVGVDAAIANSIRRVLIAEVYTEKVVVK